MKFNKSLILAISCLPLMSCASSITVTDAIGVVREIEQTLAIKDIKMKKDLKTMSDIENQLVEGEIRHTHTEHVVSEFDPLDFKCYVACKFIDKYEDLYFDERTSTSSETSEESPSSEGSNESNSQTPSELPNGLMGDDMPSFSSSSSSSEESSSSDSGLSVSEDGKVRFKEQTTETWMQVLENKFYILSYEHEKNIKKYYTISFLNKSDAEEYFTDIIELDNPWKKTVNLAHSIKELLIDYDDDSAIEIVELKSKGEGSIDITTVGSEYDIRLGQCKKKVRTVITDYLNDEYRTTLQGQRGYETYKYYATVATLSIEIPSIEGFTKIDLNA